MRISQIVVLVPFVTLAACAGSIDSNRSEAALVAAVNSSAQDPEKKSQGDIQVTASLSYETHVLRPNEVVIKIKVKKPALISDVALPLDVTATYVSPGGTDVELANYRIANLDVDGHVHEFNEYVGEPPTGNNTIVVVIRDGMGVHTTYSAIYDWAHPDQPTADYPVKKI